MSGEIRWGILGCGNVTEVKSGPGLYKAQGSTVAACMRRDREKARDYARRHNIPLWYDNAQELIDDPGVNAVYIATPPGTHKEYVLKAAQAGKTVYVEKPPALNATDLEEMIAFCKEAGVPLFVAYYRRGLDVFNKVKMLIEEGAIGTPGSLTLIMRKPPSPALEGEELPWRYRREASGGGLFVDLGSHQLDILDWILGPIEEARGFALNRSDRYEVEDCLAAAFRFKNGVLGTGIWDFKASAQAEEDSIEITGDKGKILFSAFAHQKVTLINNGGTQEWDLPYAEHVQQPLIQTMVNELNGQGQCASTGESALRTTKIMDSLLAEFYGGS
jgi:predicted dehydrogenase